MKWQRTKILPTMVNIRYLKSNELHVIFFWFNDYTKSTIEIRIYGNIMRHRKCTVSQFKMLYPVKGIPSDMSLSGQFFRFLSLMFISHNANDVPPLLKYTHKVWFKLNFVRSCIKEVLIYNIDDMILFHRIKNPQKIDIPRRYILEHYSFTQTSAIL